MDQPRKVVKPARGQLNRGIKFPGRCIRGKYTYDMYCCLHLFTYKAYFLFGDMYIRARFTAVYTSRICAYIQRYRYISWSMYYECVCVFFLFILDIKFSLDVPAGVTREEGHRGFFIHLPFAVRALIFLARRFSHSFPSSTVMSNFVY